TRPHLGGNALCELDPFLSVRDFRCPRHELEIIGPGFVEGLLPMLQVIDERACQSGVGVLDRPITEPQHRVRIVGEHADDLMRCVRDLTRHAHSITLLTLHNRHPKPPGSLILGCEGNIDYHVVSTSFRIVGEDVSEVGGTNGYDTGRTLRPLSTSRALPAHRMGSGRGHRRTGTLRLDTPAGSARPGARRSMLARAGRLRRSYRLSPARLGFAPL